VVLWNLQNREMDMGPKVSSNGGGLRDLTFNSNGTELAIGDGEGDLILWNTEDNSKISQPLVGNPLSDETIQSVAFAAQGNALAVVDGEDLYLSDSGSPRTMGTAISVSSVGYTNAVFSPNASTLFVSDGHAQISVWDVGSRQQIGSINASNSSAFATATPLVVSPDGRTLAVNEMVESTNKATVKDVVTLYPSRDWGDGSAIAKLCSELGEGLTRSQWTQYVPGEPYRRICSSA
jgi:WD40 repeat protein